MSTTRKMDIQEQLKDHEKRIKMIEEKMIFSLDKPNLTTLEPFAFTERTKNHTELLEELLKSEYCHTKNGLTFDEILQIFYLNKRPVVPKKIRNLLSAWKKRRRIEAVKSEGKLNYFWIESEN